MTLNKDYVILLHGLSRTRRSMAKLERALISHGYFTINVDYPSTTLPIEQLALSSIEKAIAKCTDASQIHFVTHSMGGILLRYYLKHVALDKLGRTVMLGPPNQGSEIVDKIGNWQLFKMINGPAGQQLGTSTNSLPNQLGKVEFELAVIAGSKGFTPFLSSFIPSPNDGKVSVESTKINGMQHHLILPVSHSFMMNNQQVIGQTIHFLNQGRFNNLATN
jgi:triacylglycerol lipase